MTLDEFISNDMQEDIKISSNKEDDLIKTNYSEPYKKPEGKDFSFFAEVFDNEFTIEQVKLLYQMSLRVVNSQSNSDNFDLKMYDYLLLKLRHLNAKKDVVSRFGYLKFIIDLDEKLL